MILFLKKWKNLFTFAALLSCFVNILQLIFPFYMFTIYGNIVISYSMISLANITAVAFFAVMILCGFIYLRSRLLAMAGKSLVMHLRKDLFSGMIRASVLNRQRAYQSGLNDLDTLQRYTSAPAVYSLFDAPWSPFYLALIFLFQPGLGLIAAGGAVVMIVLSVLQEKLVRGGMNRAVQASNRNRRFVNSFLRNVEVINGMGMINAITDRFVRQNREVISNQTRSSCYAGTIQAVIKPLQNVIQVLIYCAGAVYAMTEGMDVGLMVASSIIMGRALSPLMQVMGAWRQTYGAWEAYRRLKRFSLFLDQNASPMPLPAPRGDIKLSGAFCRAGSVMLLRNISFHLPAGRFMGIIGPSGAGKTTLCRLLLGAWPAVGGRVLLDGNDMFMWDKEFIGRYVGYLPQEIELFPGTVAENIARLGEVDGKAVEDVLALSGISRMVEALPSGLETHLEGRDGIRLSGGQRQKIGLARALYQRPRVLILDEPTSNMDEQGEQQLLQVLELLHRTRACTCIMVTHKPSLLQSMDEILVMQKGAVAMCGPRDQVFSRLTGGQ